MSEVTRLLDAAAAGDAHSAAELLPLVYDELRKLAAAKLAGDAASQSLVATALVHEAYMRLIGDQTFANRDHFFASSAEAMRRILVDHARIKARQKRGGDRKKIELSDIPAEVDTDPHLLLSLDESLTGLAIEDEGAAVVAKLHLFTGLSIAEAATVLEVSRATAYRNWKFARAWLQDALFNNT